MPQSGLFHRTYGAVSKVHRTYGAVSRVFKVLKVLRVLKVLKVHAPAVRVQRFIARMCWFKVSVALKARPLNSRALPVL